MLADLLAPSGHTVGEMLMMLALALGTGYAAGAHHAYTRAQRAQRDRDAMRQAIENHTNQERKHNR